jgi:AAA-like domain/CHAT domain
MSTNPKKILILAANPLETVQLELDKEVAEIRATLQKSENRENFVIEYKSGVGPDDLQEYMYSFQPHIVHFSGHGLGGNAQQEIPDSRKLTVVTNEKLDIDSAPEGLVFQDKDNQLKLVSGKVLANLFSLFDDDNQVECVLLNACYSKIQAQKIVQHIPYVIGMNQAIGDYSARQFAKGFYRAIWSKASIETAFDSGRNAIELEGQGAIPEDLTPVLLRRSEFSQSLIPETNLENIINNLENPEGQVRIESRFYIPSLYEERCYQEIQKAGALIRIKSPQNMGKSSLMVRVLNQSKSLGYRTVTIDLRQANQRFFNNLDHFMQWFCASVGKKLDVRVTVDKYWDDIFGANDNSTE